MSLLYGKTSVFIDFEGMLYDTDTYVVRELYQYLLDNPDEYSMFESLYEVMDNISIENLKYVLQLKSFPNPLMEFINALDEEGEEDTDLEEVADEIYRSTLYTFQLPKEEPTEDTNMLELTAIGKGLKSIINDTNFDTLYIYIREKLNDDLCEFVSVQLDSKCNIVFLTGDKKQAMTEHICDFYFLSKLSDVYHIATKHYDDEINVVVPTFEFNMDDNDPPLVNLEENAIITKRKYNIEVCTTNIPIV